MDIEEYKVELEVLIEDAGLEVKPSLINKLVKKAKELEIASDELTEEDIYEELYALIPESLDDDTMTDLIAVFADLVVSEQDTVGGGCAFDDDSCP